MQHKKETKASTSSRSRSPACQKKQSTRQHNTIPDPRFFPLPHLSQSVRAQLLHLSTQARNASSSKKRPASEPPHLVPGGVQLRLLLSRPGKKKHASPRRAKQGVTGLLALLGVLNKHKTKRTRIHTRTGKHQKNTDLQQRIRRNLPKATYQTTAHESNPPPLSRAPRPPVRTTTRNRKPEPHDSGDATNQKKKKSKRQTSQQESENARLLHCLRLLLHNTSKQARPTSRTEPLKRASFGVT